MNENLKNKIKHQELVEKICIEICKAHGINPDRLVCKSIPELLNYPFLGGYYLPNPQLTMPAWWLYRDLVELTLKLSK